MLKTILMSISIVLLSSFLIFRFLVIFNDSLPKRLIKTKFYHYFGTGIFILAASLTAFWHLLPENKGPSVFDNLKRNKAYFQDSRYWDPYLQYRDEEVTKIIHPLFNQRMAVFGNWKRIEEVFFQLDPNNIYQTEPAFAIRKMVLENDSDISLKFYLQENSSEVSYQYIFNRKGNLIKRLGGASEESFIYNDQDKQVEYTSIYGDQIVSKWIWSYDKDYDYTVLKYNHKSIPIIREKWTFEKRGFPEKMVSEQNQGGTSIESFNVSQSTVFRHIGKEMTEEIDEVKNQVKIKNSYDSGFAFSQSDTLKGPRQYPSSFSVHLKSDAKDNWWIARFIGAKSKVNSQRPVYLTLRKITYQDGSVVGSTNPNSEEVINFFRLGH